MFALLKHTIILLFIYLYLHNPLFSFLNGIGACKILYPIAFYYGLLHFDSWFYVIKKFLGLFYIFVGLILFSSIRALLGGDPTYIYVNIVFLVECFLLPTAFLTFWTRNNYNFSLFIKILLACSSLAAFITCLCVLIPTFNHFVKFNLLMLDHSMSGHDYRGFGISDALTNSYGYIQGASAVIGLYYIKENKWYIVFFALVLFSVLLNARTGILIFVLGLIIYLFYYRQIKTLFLILFIGLPLLYFSIDLFYLLGLPSQTIHFVEDFFHQFSGSSVQDISNNAGTATALYEMIILPTYLSDWFLGTGVNYFSFRGSNHTDVGYCLQLLYGGFFYLFLLSFFIMELFYGMKKNSDKGFILSTFFLLSIFVLNIKADIIANCGFMRLMFLLYFIIVGSNSTNYKSIE